MKSTLGSLIFLLVLLLASSFPLERKGSPSSAAKEKHVQYAPWDDVNVIAHGLLQLGQGLKEHVDRTKVQMRDVSTKLKAFNRTVSDLGKESQRLRAEGDALRARAQGLDDREAQLLNVTAELRDRAEELHQDRRTIGTRVGRLEERVDTMLQGGGATKDSSDARNIQVLLEAQNKRMDDMMDRIRLQQEKLDKQNVRIRTLQNQIQHSRPRPSSSSSSSSDSITSISSISNVGRVSSEQQDAPSDMATDCHELFLRGETTSGLYNIQPVSSDPFQVYCHMTTDGGWTVIQRRQDGSVDFDQLWESYEKGFGSLNGEFWLGLEKIYQISKSGGYVLSVELSDWNDDVATVRLPFHLGGEDTKYSLHTQKLGPLSPLEMSLGTDTTTPLPFSTRDQDNDRKNDSNCAKHLSGGWWFGSCGHSNLNGRYFQSPPPKQRHQRKQSIFWKTWRGRYYPLKFSMMMIAPAAIQNKS